MSGKIALRYPDGPRRLEDGGHWNLLAGQPTDDSELALSLARSLLGAGSFDEEEIARSYAAWYDSAPFDIGSTTSAALSAAARAQREGRPVAEASRHAANTHSQANGALMRVYPLAIFGCEAAPEQLAAWARRDALLTHPNEVCQSASVAFTFAIARLISGRGEREDALEATIEWSKAQRLSSSVIEVLEAARARNAPALDGADQGHVILALQNAFYQLSLIFDSLGIEPLRFCMVSGRIADYGTTGPSVSVRAW